jgi:hypothetical protein
MSYFVGIDLHSDNSYVGVIDKKDSRIFGKKLPNDLGVILKALEPFQKKIQGIAVESTYKLVLVGGRTTGGEIQSTPGQSCGDAAVLWHEVHG